MQMGREIDTRVATEIFGYEVFFENKELYETTENGPRPLAHYSGKMEFAWLVAEKMRVSLIPIEGGQWFAFFSKHEGWDSPEAFLTFLKQGDFSKCGASVGENAAQVICEAALVAKQKQLDVIASLGSKPTEKPEKPDTSSTIH